MEETESRIAILLSTCNGEPYLPELLESLRTQEYGQWDLWVRDDGSTDATVEVLKSFREQITRSTPDNRITISEGKNIGVVRSFFTLLAGLPDGYAGFAFCDQDDYWLPDKLTRAVHYLDRHSDKRKTDSVPYLYHSRQLLVNDHGDIKGKSPLPRHSGFPNALIQNQVAGCTMVVNNPLRDCILEGLPARRTHTVPKEDGAGKPGRTDRTGEVPSRPAEAIIMHDWWCYIIATGLGIVEFDPHPTIKFRRHEHSATPVTTTLYRAWMNRALALRKRSWSLAHIMKQAELWNDLYVERLINSACKTSDPKTIMHIKSLLALRDAGLLTRIGYFFTGKHRRAIWPETLLFRLMILFSRY